MPVSFWVRLNIVRALDQALGSRLRHRHNGSNAARQAKVCFRPRLEALEERWAPAVYNNAAQWSAIDNPNGVWSYGYLAPSSTPAMPDASTFNLYTEEVQVPVASGFIGDWRIPGNDAPNAAYNPLDQIVSVGTVTWQPGQASFHPGPNGEYSDYRFTAPTAGDYSLSATFSSIDTVGGRTRTFMFWSTAVSCTMIPFRAATAVRKHSPPLCPLRKGTKSISLWVSARVRISSTVRLSMPR